MNVTEWYAGENVYGFKGIALLGLNIEEKKYFFGSCYDCSGMILKEASLRKNTRHFPFLILLNFCFLSFPYI